MPRTTNINQSTFFYFDVDDVAKELKRITSEHWHYHLLHNIAYLVHSHESLSGIKDYLEKHSTVSCKLERVQNSSDYCLLRVVASETNLKTLKKLNPMPQLSQQPSLKAV